jgi:hypothetical protein
MPSVRGRNFPLDGLDTIECVVLRSTGPSECMILLCEIPWMPYPFRVVSVGLHQFLVRSSLGTRYRPLSGQIGSDPGASSELLA